MEKYPWLFYERIETPEIPEIRASWSKTKEIHVFWSVIVSDANGGKQTVSIIQLSKRSYLKGASFLVIFLYITEMLALR